MVSEFSRKVVVGGLPRSGTTLLRFILDASGEFLTLPETNFFLLPLWQRAGSRLERYVEQMSSKLDMSSADIVAAIRDNATSVSAFEAIAAAYSRSKDVSVPGWCEKSPPNCFHYHRIAYEADDVHFISMIRDGLDVVTSIIPDHPKRGGEYWFSIQCYIDSMAAVMNFDSPRHLVLRYEDLVGDPSRVLQRLSDFLGVELPQRALNDFKKESRTRDLAKVNQSKLASPLSRSWVGRWRQPQHRDRVEEFLSNQWAVHWQREAGYEIG